MQHYTVYLFLENCSTCFGWYLHPSSGAHTTIFTICGTCLPLLLPALLWESWSWPECGVGIEKQIGTVPIPHSGSNSSTIEACSNNGQQVPDIVNTVVCAPDDGWRYRPKHVDHFSRNK
jgi:hypothetical protein